MASDATLVPEHLHGLLDDAALLAPDRPTAAEGLARWRSRREEPFAALLGCLLVEDRDLAALADAALAAAAEAAADPVRLGVVVTGGAGAVAPAVTWAAGAGLRLERLELTVRESDAGDLAPNARRLVAAVDDLLASGALPDDVRVHLTAPPLPPGEPSATWLDVLDEVAAADHGLTLRADEHGPAELAACIAAALDRELRFGCTVLDRPVATRDASGRLRHGFLNVLAATRASLDGAGVAEVAEVLERTQAGAWTRPEGAAGLVAARRWFTGARAPSVAAAGDALAALDPGRVQER